MTTTMISGRDNVINLKELAQKAPKKKGRLLIYVDDTVSGVLKKKDN